MEKQELLSHRACHLRFIKLFSLKVKLRTLKTHKNKIQTLKITVMLFNFVFLCLFWWAIKHVQHIIQTKDAKTGQVQKCSLSSNLFTTDSKVRIALYSIIKSTSHRKVLLSNFHLNGHTLGFHPQT